jgi:hypothetical protein
MRFKVVEQARNSSQASTPVSQAVSLTRLEVRDICVERLCIVMKSDANQATDVSATR